MKSCAPLLMVQPKKLKSFLKEVHYIDEVDQISRRSSSSRTLSTLSFCEANEGTFMISRISHGFDLARHEFCQILTVRYS